MIENEAIGLEGSEEMNEDEYKIHNACAILRWANGRQCARHSQSSLNSPTPVATHNACPS